MKGRSGRLSSVGILFSISSYDQETWFYSGLSISLISVIVPFHDNEYSTDRYDFHSTLYKCLNHGTVVLRMSFAKQNS